MDCSQISFLFSLLQPSTARHSTSVQCYILLISVIISSMHQTRTNVHMFLKKMCSPKSVIVKFKADEVSMPKQFVVTHGLATFKYILFVTIIFTLQVLWLIQRNLIVLSHLWKQGNVIGRLNDSLEYAFIVSPHYYAIYTSYRQIICVV